MWKVLHDMIGGGLEFRLMTGVTLTDPSTGQSRMSKFPTIRRPPRCVVTALAIMGKILGYVIGSGLEICLVTAETIGHRSTKVA
jgi:hypothetical protein